MRRPGRDHGPCEPTTRPSREKSPLPRCSGDTDPGQHRPGESEAGAIVAPGARQKRRREPNSTHRAETPGAGPRTQPGRTRSNTEAQKAKHHRHPVVVFNPRGGNANGSRNAAVNIAAPVGNHILIRKQRATTTSRREKKNACVFFVSCRCWTRFGSGSPRIQVGPPRCRRSTRFRRGETAKRGPAASQSTATSRAGAPESGCRNTRRRPTGGFEGPPEDAKQQHGPQDDSEAQPTERGKRAAPSTGGHEGEISRTANRARHSGQEELGLGGKQQVAAARQRG